MTGTAYTYKDFSDAVFKLLDEYSLNGVRDTVAGSFRTDAEKRLSLYLGNSAAKVYKDFPEVKRAALVLPSLPVLYSAENLTLGNGDSVTIPVKTSGANVPAFACHAVISGGLRVITRAMLSQSVSGEFESEPGEYREVRINLPAPDDEYAFEIKPNDSGKCVIKSIAIYCLSDSAYDIPYTDIPSLGKCAARLPDDCSRLRKVIFSNGDKASPELFTVSDGLIEADAGLCGNYGIEYEVKSPAFSEDMAAIVLSDEKFSLITRLCAAELCPTESSELYMRLAASYSAFAEALRKNAASETRRRNSFYGKCRRLAARLNYGKKGV